MIPHVIVSPVCLWVLNAVFRNHLYWGGGHHVLQHANLIIPNDAPANQRASSWEGRAGAARSQSAGRYCHMEERKGNQDQANSPWIEAIKLPWSATQPGGGRTPERQPGVSVGSCQGTQTTCCCRWGGCCSYKVLHESYGKRTACPSVIQVALKVHALPRSRWGPIPTQLSSGENAF